MYVRKYVSFIFLDKGLRLNKLTYFGIDHMFSFLCFINFDPLIFLSILFYVKYFFLIAIRKPCQICIFVLLIFFFFKGGIMGMMAYDTVTNTYKKHLTKIPT